MTDEQGAATSFAVQLSYMTRTEPLTEETLAYLVRIEAEHARHWSQTPLDVSDPVVREAQVEGGDDRARQVAQELEALVARRDGVHG